ncbi:MAG TPA: protein kinase [Polyangiaceae bacterium]|nr:protein kinase [Polyangiaceae bacterium]
MPILTPEEQLGLRVAGRYRLDAILSTGGMGVLFEARDEVTGERVAVKMLKPPYSLERGRVERFLRETRIASELRHPNVATVLDLGEDSASTPYLVMELLEGHSLAKELEARGTLPFAEAVAILLPIADALAAAHGKGIVHRDVKPGNIFLCRDRRGDAPVRAATVPKLVDFGIAKSARDDFETDTGVVVGTPGYMAPEQLLHGECGPFTDVWGVGAVLYRCLMGRPPHAGDSVPEALGKLLREPVSPVSAEGVGRAVCATIDRALARDPHRRYASMAAFARELALVVSSPNADATAEAMPTFEAPAPGWPSPSPSPWRRHGFSRAAGLVGFLSAGVLLLASRSDRQRVGSSTAPSTRASAPPVPSALESPPPNRPDAVSTFASAAQGTNPLARVLAVASGAASRSSTPPADRHNAGRRVRSPGESPQPTEVPAGPERRLAATSPPEGVEREPGTGLPVIVRW